MSLNNDASTSIAPKFDGINSIPSALQRGPPILLDIIDIDIQINVIVSIVIIIIRILDNISFH